VLFRTPYFPGPVKLAGVPALRGHVTADPRRLAEADAVVFHFPDWRPDQLNDTPRYPGQLWVGWSCRRGQPHLQFGLEAAFLALGERLLGRRRGKAAIPVQLE
jgi:alpha-1,3-fucosyltransferase 10